jgi:hypothetical protein
VCRRAARGGEDGYALAFKEVSRAAYAQGGHKAQYAVTMQCGPERFARAVVRTIRRLKLDLVLAMAQTR